MDNVVQFPRHARASSVFAASQAKISAVRPASLAVSVAKTRVHHPEGMLLRCHHLETARSKAPTSDAIASRVSQSSITERNDEGESAIPEEIRQTVLKLKDNMSGDGLSPQGQTVLMRKPKSVSDFKEQFTAKIARARYDSGHTQASMAIALGLAADDHPNPASTYGKYETRSMMPHHLIPIFCGLVEKPTGWLYSGPRVERPIEKRGRKPKPAKRVA